MTYLDTNILIYLMEGHPRYGRKVASSLELLANQKQEFITSAITVTEFLAGTSSSSLATIQQVPKLKFITLNETLAERAADLQRKHAGLRIGDAIHLATAIEEHAKLFFTNDKPLENIIASYLAVQTL